MTTPDLSGDARNVMRFYEPHIQPVLETSLEDQKISPVASINLVFALLSAHRALAVLSGDLSEDFGLPPEKIVSYFEKMGLGSEADLIAHRFLLRPISDVSLHVISGKEVSPQWFRRKLQETSFWEKGISGNLAVFIHHVTELSRDLKLAPEDEAEEDRKVRGLIADFGKTTKSSEGFFPLTEDMKAFLESDLFVGRATQALESKKKAVMAFLNLGSSSWGANRSTNESMFPSFESFQRIQHRDPILNHIPHNNFYLYFVDVPGNVHREKKKVFREFVKGYPALEGLLTHLFTERHRVQAHTLLSTISSAELLLYEAFLLMASCPSAQGTSLIS